MSRPPPVSGQMASPKDQTMPTEKTLPPVKYLPLRKRLTIEGMKTPKKQCVKHELNHQDQTLSSHKYSTATEKDALEDTNDIKNTPLAKVYKTVVIQQKMAFGKGPCNPLLWNNEDAEKNAPWMAVEESINSFKSAWFESDTNEDAEVEEEEKPIKKTAKRGRPSSNSKQRSIESDPNVPKRKNSSLSTKRSDLFDSKLYCICRQPYDATRFMIACDRCDDWFHGECISIREIDSDFVDLYFCSKCSQATGKKTSWKPKCANPACCRAARISSHLGYLSKYCSNVCGMQVARARLELLEIKRRHATNANHLTPISELVLAKQRQSRINSCADREDRERLIQIRQEQKDIKAAVDILKRKGKLVELLVGLRPFIEQDENVPCGFDSRLVWNDDIWSKINHDPILDAQMQIRFDSNEPFDVCQRLKCIKHRQWQKISLIEIKQEKKELFKKLIDLEQERNQIKTRMRKRRSHSDLIKDYLLNNSISM